MPEKMDVFLWPKDGQLAALIMCNELVPTLTLVVGLPHSFCIQSTLRIVSS